MYEAYWQLHQKPFEGTADPRFYYPGEPQQAAILKLRYAIENRRSAALLCGASGTGKTLVGGMLRATLDASFSPIVHLVFPQMPTAELLGYLADEMEGEEPGAAPTTTRRSVRRIKDFLGKNAHAGHHAVLIVDEAHLIDSAETFESLRLLLNFETEGQPGITLLLCGQTALLPKLERMPALEERLSVKSLLRPLTERETGEYVSHRLRVAGATSPIFDPQAMAALHGFTQGIPRRINRLCDLALLIGFAEERKTIGAEHLESVAQELVAVTPE